MKATRYVPLRFTSQWPSPEVTPALFFLIALACFFLAAGLRRNQAETQVPDAVVGRVPVAVRGAAVPGDAAPAAPAHNARRTSSRPNWIN